MHRFLRLGFSFCFFVSLITLPMSTTDAQQLMHEAQVLEPALVGKPIAAGHNLFWLRRHEPDGNIVIVSYDVRRKAEQVLHQAPSGTRALASDGEIVAWIERTSSGYERIQGYSLATRRSFTLVESAHGFGSMALENSMLFYQDASPEHRGLFARTLVSAEERRISATGRDPVAADGILLWAEEQRDDPYLPARSSLHMLKLDGRAKQVVLAQSTGHFSGYAAAGDYVAWSAAAPAVDRRVYLHRVSSSSTFPMSTGPALFPILRQHGIAWTSEPRATPDTPSSWSLQATSIGANASSTVIAASSGPLATWAITSDQRIVFTAESNHQSGTLALYLAPFNQGNVTLPPLEQPTPTAPWDGRSLCFEPLHCGQVRMDGAYLYDNAGRWPVNGVQFFLPQYGINTWTFHDGNYWKSTNDIDRWLDVARDQLAARLLRVFVELPSGSYTPTSHAVVYDFALRANARGMRLGLVLQNSTDFRMTAERHAWIDELISYFEERGATSLIGYVNAANEINNWCATQDCFDNNPAYVDAATEWVAQLASIFRSRNSTILTTVGISTEVRDRDGRPAWYAFFQPDRFGRSLANLVDFLSPHNYGGGGYGIINDLRYVHGYNRAVVLEEYGFPTDPLSRDTRYTEGTPICRDDPWAAQCVNTAPYFVEWSTRAIRETSYAGGVAWMLADNIGKRCDQDPPDLWTGLFAIAGNYCGGTYSTGDVQPKATAHRVMLHHSQRTPHEVRVRSYLPIVGR